MNLVEILCDKFSKIECKDERVVALLVNKEAKQFIKKNKRFKKKMKKYKMKGKNPKIFGAKLIVVPIKGVAAFICVGEYNTTKNGTLFIQ